MKKRFFEVRRGKSFADHGGYTFSQLFLDGKPLLTPAGKQVVGLEDEYRAEKVHGETRIDAGTYRLIVTHSPKFKRNLIEGLNVNKFTSIRWHSGNTEDHTDGCLLLGDTIGKKGGKPAIFGGISAGVEKYVTDLVSGMIAKGEEVYAVYIDPPN